MMRCTSDNLLFQVKRFFPRTSWKKSILQFFLERVDSYYNVWLLPGVWFHSNRFAHRDKFLRYIRKIAKFSEVLAIGMDKLPLIII